MRIALAQLAASPNRAANLDRALEAMTAASRAGAELIAFPEVILDRFFPQNPGDEKALELAEPIPGPTTERVSEHAGRLSLVTVFNLYERDERGRRFDSSPVFDADGRLLGVTRMIHITDYEGFHERDYYHPGDKGAPVYETRAGKIGVAICYDRHYPEVMRALGVAGAEVVVIPQAGTVGEWPEGLYEAEVRTAAFQNGYFAALANRVGEEGKLHFSGESFAVDPEGRVLARGKSCEEDLVFADLDLSLCATSTARRLFWRDRRPELYNGWLGKGGEAMKTTEIATETGIAHPEIVSREEWLRERKRLLTHEKELTKHRDQVNAQRRRLPMVRIEKDYVFDAPGGKKSLQDLFEGRRQLIVYHFMFDPKWDKGCPGCTGYVSSLGDLSMLDDRDTAFALISRAPLAKLEAYKAKMGWNPTWVSSFGSDFNYDFHVTLDEKVAPPEYNYRNQADMEAIGGHLPEGEAHGLSVFFRMDDDLFHTYSSYARGVEGLTNAYYLLDVTPYGRQEDFEDSPDGWPQRPTYG